MIRRIIQKLLPPDRWRAQVIILLGVICGLVAFLFYVSKAHSYISDSPQTCVNCHIMAPQYATWSHSSHRICTNCNDCHVPQNNILSHYFFKAKDGMRHSAIFTIRTEPSVIFILPAGQKVVQKNCLRCHENLMTDYKLMAYNKEIQKFRNERKCWECHRETPHGRVNGIASVPNAQAPLPESPVPGWLRKIMSK
ncbi:MAG: cytochrome c nitrite reductase small subunit [bacterium]